MSKELDEQLIKLLEEQVETLTSLDKINNQIIDGLKAEITAGKDRSFKLGYKQGLRAYAHWKDGKQMVGTCGKTLVQAFLDFEEENNANAIAVGLINEGAGE